MEITRNFVIQTHSRKGETHWDLMLEVDGTLQTWRLKLPPKDLIKNRTSAVKIFDHPVKFLTYEGPVNKGQGKVRIADSGKYQILAQTEEELKLQFTGEIIAGVFQLTRIDGDNWQLKPLSSGI